MKYFTLILKDNYDNNDRFHMVNKIVEVKIEDSGLHYIVNIFGEKFFRSKWANIDLGYYEHKIIDNKLWNLIL